MAYEDDPDKIAADLLRKIANDPRTRRVVTKAIKQVDPERYGPYSFPDQTVEDLREEFTAKEEERKAKDEQDRINAKYHRQREKLLEKGYDEETLKAIEAEVVEKYGIPDLDVAAKVYASNQPEPQGKREPPPRPGERWSLPSFEQFKTDPVKAALDGAYRDIEGIRSGQIRTS